MAEVVLRKTHKRADRWMPRKRWLTRTKIVTIMSCLAKTVPGYVLSFADLLGIPSGFGVALVCAAAALSKNVRLTIVGGMAAVAVRAISGMSPHWEALLVLPVLLLIAPTLLSGRGNLALMALSAAAMLPTAILGTIGTTAAETLMAWGSAAIAALSAPVFARALTAISANRNISGMEERLSVGFLAAMLLCGAARMALLGVNLGVLGASGAVTLIAIAIGPAAGCLLGLLFGLTLALLGIPLVLSIALSVGGFLSGVVHTAQRRRWTCPAFAIGAYLVLLLTGWTDTGMASGVLTGPVIVALLPRGAYENLLSRARRFLADDLAPGDAYAASALADWQRTIAAMANAVPSPRDAIETRTAAWWEAHLCESCPDRQGCGAMTTELAVARAESIWNARNTPDDVWQIALDNLRGLGCQRLYHLMDGMNALRREDETRRHAVRQAEMQRDMLVTHLLAMSGAARKFAMRSGGNSWWDEVTGRKIRQLLDESAMPARLKWLRKVNDHVQCGLELDQITAARKQSEALCDLVSAAAGVNMRVSAIDGDRVTLAECPPHEVVTHIATAPITGGTVCGDMAQSGTLADGRVIVTLSDGMGHGSQAALISQQTVELLRLCLDAGYSHQQALTAVNGMLLMGDVGERFATADLVTIDPWTCRATIEKLGAAPSYLICGCEITRLTGDALPLGIIERIDSKTHALRLEADSVLILLTDGVEDAFRSQDALENTLLLALREENPADFILDCALKADDGQRRDDQSCVVIRLDRPVESRYNEEKR